MRIKTVGATLLFLILIAGCVRAANETTGETASDPEESVTEIDDIDHERLVVLGTGAYGLAAQGDINEAPGRRAPFVLVARNREQLEQLWTTHISSEPPPSVDLEKRLVVFLLLPLRSSGGYSVEPHSWRLEGERILIDAELHQPGQGTMTTQALTAPWAVVTIPRPVSWTSVDWINDGRLLARRNIDE